MAKPNKASAKRERALNCTKKRLEKKEEAEKEKRASAERERVLENAKKEEDGLYEKLKKENDVLRKQVQQLLDNSKKLEEGTAQFKKDIEFYDFRLERARERIQMLEEQTERYRKELFDQNSTLENLKLQLEEQKSEDPQFLLDTVALYEEEMEERVEQLVKESPTGGARLKEFGMIKKKDTKKERSKKVLKCMELIVGKSNVNAFVYDFVQYLSSHKEVEFSLCLSEWDSFYATIRWNLTNGMLREFHKFSKSKLSFDVFSSLTKIRKLKKRNTIVQDNNITVHSTIKTTRSGKEVKSSSAIVVAKNLSVLISRRLEELHKNGRLIMDERKVIVLGFGGDKGADTTKLCIVFENVDNPNDPHGILLIGFYSGHDDYANLKAMFITLFQQINSLRSIKYLEGEVEVTRDVIILPTGDCKFISAMYNHAGQSSLEPCFRCKISFVNHGRNKATIGNFRFEECGQTRTVQQMINEGNDPLLHVEPCHAAPPGLHTFIGIAQKYFVDWFVALAVNLDFKQDQLPVDLLKQRHHLKQLSYEASGYYRQTQSLQHSVEAISLAVTAFANNSRRGNYKKSSESPCDSTHCIASKYCFKIVEKFQCRCKKDFHLVCELFFDEDDAHRLDSHLKCLDCQYDTDVDVEMRREILSEKREAAQKELNNFSEALAEVIEEQLALESLLDKSSGDARRRFEGFLQSIGCDHRVWYQEMTGNQTRALLRPANISNIVDLFTDIMTPMGRDTDELKLMGEAMNDLAFLMSQSGNASKSDEEIDNIENVIRCFVIRIRQLLPDFGVTTKLHLLCAHLVQHLREHHSWGRVSEQGIESLHGLMNTLETRYASVRNVVLHATLILEQFSHYNTIFDNGSSW